MRLIHAADVHFGASDPAVLAAASDAIMTARADMMLVSGDLTQRGKRQEFKAARAWVDLQNLPTVVVPGNHDTPLLNMPARLTGAFKRYAIYFGDLTRPLTIKGVRVDTLNTSRGWQARTNWAEGAVDLDYLQKIESEDTQSTQHRILACHHPFLSPEGAPLKARTRRGQRASTWFGGSKFSLLLTGHVHTPHAELVTEPTGSYLAITSGTLSLRLRQSPPSFNVLSFEGDTVSVGVKTLLDGRFQETAKSVWYIGSEEPFRSLTV